MFFTYVSPHYKDDRKQWCPDQCTATKWPGRVNQYLCIWLVYPSLSDHLYSYFLNFLVHLSLLCEEYPLIYNGEIIRTQNHSSYACWQFGMDNGSSVLLFKASVQPFSFFFCSWERHVCAYMCVYTHRHLYIGNNGIFFNCITLHYSPIT